jgi:preprotein translocase subunit YajC
MFAYLLLLAEGAAPQQQPANPLGIFGNPLILLAMLALFYIVVMLPASRRAKREQQQMLANIKPGAKVVTSAGIVGKVVKAKDGEDEITVQSEDAKLRVLRSTVVRVVGEETVESK